MSRLFYGVVLGIVLTISWAVLSGRTEPLLLVSLGAGSILTAVFVTARFGILDEDAAPYHRSVALLRYWGWLGGEIVKANLQVARAVLKVDLDISPVVFRVRAPQKSDLAQTVFANSITLTPGTVTLDVDGDHFIVHALLEEMADPAGFEEMSKRASRAAEGGWL